MKKVLFCLIVTCITTSAFAFPINGRFVESSDKAYIKDLFTGLIWTRCSIGFAFRNGICEPIPQSKKEFTYLDAKDYLKSALPGWRIPTTKETASLVACTSREDGAVFSGYKLIFNSKLGFFKLSDNEFNFKYACSGDRMIGKVDKTAFPDHEAVGTRHSIWTSDSSAHTKYPCNYVFLKSMPAPGIMASYLYNNDNYSGPHENYLAAVTSESDVDNDIGFGRHNAQDIDNLKGKIPATTLIWKSIDGSGKTKNEVFIDTLPLDKILLAMVLELVKADFDVVPAEHKAPIPADFTVNAVTSQKDEFETTKAYEERIAKEKLDAKKEAEKKFFDALNSYNTTVVKREQLLKGIEKEQSNPEYYRQKLIQAWEMVAPLKMGNPVLTNIRYDADRQEFSAVLNSSLSNFSKEVTSMVPISDAKKLKPDLLSGKVAPKVEFQFPSMSITWTLVENDALRAKKFEAATTAGQLEMLINEYPSSLEATAARTKIFDLAKNSKELDALIQKHRGWPEAATATKLLVKVQDKEFRDATAEDKSWSYEKFLANFGGADPKKLFEKAQKARENALAHEKQQAREAEAQWERERPMREARERQKALCRAQINTCIASCPHDSVFGSIPDLSCKLQCESVSCE